MSRPAGPVTDRCGERRRVLTRQVDPRRRQGGHRRHPCRDRGGERLAQERSQRHRLEGLHVTRRPVVEPDHAEQVGVGLGGRHGRAPGRAGADHEAQLGLEVEALAGPVGRPVRAVADASGPHDVGAGDDHRAGPAVVADGHVLPAGVQRRAVGTEDAAHVRGVVLAGVEVDVVGDLDGQVQADGVERVEVGGEHTLGAGIGQHVLEPAAARSPTSAGRWPGRR